MISSTSNFAKKHPLHVAYLQDPEPLQKLLHLAPIRVMVGNPRILPSVGDKGARFDLLPLSVAVAPFGLELEEGQAPGPDDPM
jgi:hypothetical protein